MASSGLQHSPADIVQWVLVNLGLGGNPNTLPLPSWPVYSGLEPSTPDNCITVYHTTGVINARLMGNGQLLEHKGIQIRLRAINATVGHTKLDTIKTYLSEQVYQVSVTIDSITYLVHAFTKFGDVLSLGKETPKSKRSLFTLNCTLPVRQKT